MSCLACKSFKLTFAAIFATLFCIIDLPHGVLAADQTQQSIQSLDLVNADDGKTLFSLQNNQTINLAELPSRNLNIIANASDDVREIIFDLNQHKKFRIEKGRPFALAGDSNSRFHKWTPRLGNSIITATPLINDKLEMGQPLTLVINVIEEKAMAQLKLPIPSTLITPLAKIDASEQAAWTSVEKTGSSSDGTLYPSPAQSKFSLILTERNLEVGSCTSIFEGANSLLSFSCQHYLKDVGEIRLIGLFEDGSSKSALCSIKKEADKLQGECLFDNGFNELSSAKNLTLEVKSSSDQQLMAFGNLGNK